LGKPISQLREESPQWQKCVLRAHRPAVRYRIALASIPSCSQAAAFGQRLSGADPVARAWAILAVKVRNTIYAQDDDHSKALARASGAQSWALGWRINLFSPSLHL